MIFWYDLYFIYFMGGATLLLSMLGLWFIAIMPSIDRWRKNFFRILFTALVLLSLNGLTNLFLFNHAVPAALLYLTIVLEALLL